MSKRDSKKLRPSGSPGGPDALSRRQLLTGAAAVAGVAALGASGVALAQEEPLQAGPRVMGAGADDLGERSAHEQLSRAAIAEYPNGMLASLTPLGDLEGTITPSDLHYEVHHHGVPEIDPSEHRLLVHGMVDNPTVYTMADIKRFPSVSRISFMECSGN
ncbi:MAG: molybdopterin-dependent oxidoreductase, partial [Caldilineaceae bacterium]